MSRPYEFSDRDNRVTSPLDRQPQTQYPPGQAPSFATNVNRAKTKKWVEAKKFSYEGDDWGDYDEQDEYGVEAAASQAPPPLPQQQINNSRIFTNPVPAPSQGPGGRRNSYDAGDEKRAFSSSQFPPPGMPGAFEPPPHQAQQGPSRSPVPLHVETSVKPGHTQTSAGSSVYPTTGESARQASATSNDTMYPEHRRDFSPSAMPTPLQTRISPMPSAISQSPASGFPPRRSSVNQNNAPNALPGAMGKSSQESTPISPSKALPFIRPADIYKRMEEEREKERKSLDSQRQSIDSARRQENTSPTGSHNPTGSGSAFGRRPSQESVSERNEGSQLRQPLDTVAERKSEYEMLTTPSNTQTGNTSQAKAPGFTGLALPQIGGESSGFGDEFWESTPLGPKEGNKAAAVPSLSGVDPAIQDSALQHQHSVGFRSMVHEAFDAPAIASKSGSQHSQGTTTNSSFSRSNTTGTSDISPIMSRVPSSAAAAARHAEARDTATPAIAEEPELHHSRNTSEGSTAAKFTPGYRRDLRTPSLDNSPARTPAVENHPELPAPEMARLAMSSPVEADAATKNVIQPLDAASREADIAKVADTNPALAATFEKIAQDSFVDKPQPDIPAYTSRNIARAESPSKGRVADLAGRFNEPPEARRGSVESIGSKKSSGLRPTSSSGVKPPFVERPIAEREISFRPKIPGGFESYMSTASEVPDTTSNATIPPAPIEKDTELTPTTSKHKLEGSTASDVGPMDALAALAAAGAAIGASIRKSMGSEEPESPRSATRAYGDVLNRPLPPDRMESTVSTIPPTPPAKDEEEYAPPVPLKTRERSRSPEISAINTSLPSLPAYVPDSTDATPSGDFESDRLRREIVRSLSPETEGFPAPLPSGPVHTNQAPNRESSAIPSEYESYWATGGDHANDDVGKPDVPNKHAENGLPDLAVAAPSQPSNDYFSSGVEATPRTSSPPPGLLGRKFSWEKSQASLASQATIVSPVAELAKSPNTLEPNKPDPLSLNPKLSGEPLHIVNAEPGELSTPVEPVRRLSEELPPPVPQVPTTKEAAPLPSSEGGLFSQLQARPPPAPQVPATQEFAPLPSSDGGLSSQFGPRPPSGPRPQTGEEPRPANFREILGIKSTPARIAKYDETREQFAKMPTGLDNWLSHTLAANPEYRDVATAVHRPTLSASGGTPVKHKPTSSISRVFTQKSESSGNVGPAPAEYQGTAEQRVSVGKGKDILKTTGVLKGMKEAKGLFAKGKSKFRGSGGEKDPSNSTSYSRSSSRTPSVSSTSMSMTSQPRPSSSRRSSRSFSPFRRFSSRPSSVIIPNNNDVPDLPHHDFSSASFKDERGRPKSYPAAAALGTDWGSPPEYEKLDGVGSSGRTDSPPPHRLKEESRVTEERGRERLGVLPSPARSAFQSEGAAGVGGGNDIVESVVRHATPALSHTVTAEERTPTQESVNAHAKTAHPGSSSDFDPTANGAVGKGPGNRSSMITPKHAPYEIGGRQRAVSLPRPEYVMPPRYYGAREEPVGLLRPEYVMPPRSGGTEKEPVSPISPLEEGDSSPEDVKPGTGLVAAAQDVSVERVSGDTLSRVSEDSWEKISNADVEGHPTTTGNSVHDVDVAKRSATPSVEVPSAIPSLKGSVQNAAVWFATSSIQGSAHDDLPPSTSATPSFQENTHSLPASTSPTTSLGRGADELLTTSKSANPSPDGSEHNVLATSTCATSSLKGSALNIPISTSETPSMTASSYKGKERAVSPVESEFFPISPSINHSRDHSAVSAILGEAQVVQVPQFQPNATNEIRNAPPPKTQPPQPSTSPPPLPQFGIGTPFEKPVRKIAVSEAQQSDRLAEIALAHKKMREQLDNFTPGSPHDFGATDEAGRKFDEVMERRSMVRGDSRSLRGVAGAPNLAVPTMTSLAPPEKGRARSKSGVSEGNLSVPSFGAEGQGSRFGGGMSNTNASILPPAGPSRQERSGRGPSEQNKPFLLGVSSGNQRAQQNNAAVGGSKAPSPAPVSRAAMEDRPLPRGPISRATPLALDQPSPLGPTMTVTEPEHELPMASQDEVEARGETVGPALSVGGRSIRDEDVTGKDNMNSSLSVGGRSMPSVSSLGRDNDISDTQSPVSQDRSVSPIKGSFENREYHPPNPNGERPMSFVPLPRDPSGLPQQEIISTTKHPIETGSPETPQRSRRNSYTRSSPSPGTPRRRSRQLSLHMDEVRESQDLYDPPSPVTSRHPQSQAPQRELSLNQGSNGGAEYQRESLTAPVPGISPVHEGQQSESEERRPSSIQESPPRAYGQMDIPSSDSPPEQEHEREVPQSHPGQDDAQQPPPHPALAAPASSPVALPGSEPKKAGMLQKIKGFASSNHASESQSGNTARLQQQQQPQKQPPPPPPELRLSSMTSSVGSQNTSMSKDKKKRSSGILSSFKRPASSGAESHLTGASVDAAGMKGQANESPTQRQTPQNVASTIPPMPTEAPQERMASLKVQNAHLPQRATTHTGEQSSMKKRFSALGSLFGRSGTTGHTPKQSKHNKNAPRSTLIHHVPPNPNPTAFTQRQQQHQGGSLNSKQQDMRRAQWLQDPEQSGVHPPLGGYYAPGNSQDNPQFGHGQGTAGFAAIAAQQGRNKSASSATSSNAKDKRSGSNSSVPWPFKRHGSSNSSGHLSPQVSAQSPLDRIRTDSLGPPSISPVSTRRDSSPGQAGYGRAPPPRLPSGRMGSISEQGFPGQHQERPWALTLPGAEEDDRDITRQEIFHAASARWQRGADGLMYALPRDEASPVTPRRQDWDSHTPTAPHPYGQQQQPPHLEPQMPRSPQRFPPGHAQGSPANPVYSYLPTHIHSPPPRPQSSPGHIVNQYQPQDEPHAITTPDAHPVVIPPLPQGNIPLMQPQPRRMSNSPAMGDQLPARASSLQDPRTGPSYRSNGGGAPAPPPKSPMRSGFTVSTTSTSTTTTTTSDQSLNGSFNPSSASTQTQKRPISTSNAYNPTSPQRSTASNAYTATSLQRSAASPPPLPPPKDIPPTPQLPSLIIPRGGPVGGSGITGPVVHSGRNDAMGSSTRSMQNAMSQQQLHARNKSRDSDDEPVMKAVSYPGDEWMPRWDID